MSEKLVTMVESNLCPLCCAPNLCLIASDGKPEKESCWCQNIDIIIPKALLASIPVDKQGVVCVCESCVTAFHV